MFCFPNRVLWMVPIYSLDSVSMFNFISLTKNFFDDTNYTCRMLKESIFIWQQKSNKKSEKGSLVFDVSKEDKV